MVVSCQVQAARACVQTSRVDWVQGGNDGAAWAGSGSGNVPLPSLLKDGYCCCVVGVYFGCAMLWTIPLQRLCTVHGTVAGDGDA